MRVTTAFIVAISGALLVSPGQAQQAWSGSIAVLGTSVGGEKAGGAPSRRKVDLDLGSLRMTHGKLPGGLSTPKERQRLRAARAEERRLEMSKSKRD